MGLDLYCIEEHVRMGSYSYVHVERANWIRAAIKYLQAHQITGLLDEICPWLLNNEINYEVMENKPSKLMKQHKLQGLHYFVVHSDCDGKWKPNESKQILKTLEKIINYMDNEDEEGDVQDDKDNKDNEDEVQDNKDSEEDEDDNNSDSSNNSENEKPDTTNKDNEQNKPDNDTKQEQTVSDQPLSKLEKHYLYKILTESVNSNYKISFG